MNRRPPLPAELRPSARVLAPHRTPWSLRRIGPRGAQRLTHDGWVDEHVGFAEPVRHREMEPAL